MEQPTGLTQTQPRLTASTIACSLVRMVLIPSTRAPDTVLQPHTLEEPMASTQVAATIASTSREPKTLSPIIQIICTWV